VSKSIQNSLKNGDLNSLFVFDAGSTIKSSGVHGNESAFIPTLTFLSGPALGKEIPLVHRELTLGRGKDCDIIIPDPLVSREHLRIICRKVVKKEEDPTLQVVLRDLGSKNGTMVNYAPIHQAVLKPGDKIFLGKVILKFDHRDLAEQGFYDEIYRLATTDSLTSLMNKATIMRQLSEEIAVLTRKKRRIAVVLVDIDGFKGMNDLHGHLMGDRILQSAAKMFCLNMRRRDKVGRFGGDEFLIVLPETGSRGAVQLAERIRKMLETTIAAELGLSIAVTASLGAASDRADAASPESLIEHADIALYRAKALGRNRVEVWKASNSLQTSASGDL
jgi:two-component system, cell cycle response regulator